jgi:hypothetical protein
MTKRPPVTDARPPVVGVRDISATVTKPAVDRPVVDVKPDTPTEVLPTSVPPNIVRARPGQNFLRMNPHVIDEVAGKVRTGLPLKYAFQALGVRHTLGTDWMRKGEQDETYSTPYYTLYMAVMAARAAFIEEQMAEKHERGKGNKGQWAEIAWTLERMFPEEFGQSKKITGSGTGGAIPFEVLDPSRRLENNRKQAGIE